MRTTITLLVTAIAISGCGTIRDSRANPFNWFSGGRSVPAEPAEATNPLIPERTGFFARARERDDAYRGTPVSAIRSVVLEPTPGGAVLRVTGTARFQDVYDVRLTPSEAASDTLAFTLDAVVPEKPTKGGTERQRSVTAALALSDQDLSGVREIRIIGADNAQSIRRSR